MLQPISKIWKTGLAIFTALIILIGVIFLITKISSLSGLALIVILLYSLAVSYALSQFIHHFQVISPLRKLSDGMDQLADKNFEFRLDEAKWRSYEDTASSFNEMAEMLSSYMNELKKNRDYIQSIFDSSADIIITVNPSGNIQTINMGAEKALGYDRLELINQPIETLFANPKERAVAIDRLENDDSVINFGTQFITKDQKARDVLLTLSYLRNPNDEIIGTIGISKDITREKRFQNQLIQSERFIAIGQVFTGIQHSLKNMLNACKGGSYMVRTGLAKDNRTMLEEGWEIVQEGISRMTDMSLDMLKYAKDWKPKYDEVDINATLADICKVVEKTAQDKGVKIVLNVPRQVPKVKCDGGMIYSAIMDIVSNAIDACLWKDYPADEKPEVSLKVQADLEISESVIIIKDNGCGMTEDVKVHIFTPFFSTKSKAGTGLGLAITARMIGIHGGKIEVESAPDKGSVFSIRLPFDGAGKSKENDHGKKGFGS